MSAITQSDVVNAAFLTVEYLKQKRASPPFEERGKVFVVESSTGIVSELEAAGIEFVLAR